MSRSWDGVERRKSSPGRRSSDRGVCAIHSTIANECEKEKADMFKKIDGLFVAFGTLVSWKVFAMLVLLTVGVIGYGFRFFGSQIGETNALITDMNRQFSGMNQTIGVVLWRMENVEKKVDKMESIPIKNGAAENGRK